MTGEVKEKKYQLSNTVLLVILGVLILLIIALIVGVVVHNTINNVNMIEGGESGQISNNTGENEGNGISPGNVVLEDDEEVNSQVSEYQDQISSTNNDEDKAELYWKRIDYIWMTVGTEKYQNQVISDAIAADNIRQTADSAYQVVNVASTYEDEKLGEEYTKKAYERLEAQGIDPSEIGEGSDRTAEE